MDSYRPRCNTILNFEVTYWLQLTLLRAIFPGYGMFVEQNLKLTVIRCLIFQLSPGPSTMKVIAERSHIEESGKQEILAQP